MNPTEINQEAAAIMKVTSFRDNHESKKNKMQASK